MELSWIQKHILFVLIRQDSARPKELRPESVEPNLFDYHLKGLIRHGLVQKVARGQYRLTVDGERFVGSFSTTTHNRVDNIKTVIMLWAEHEGQTLLFRWSRQPYLGQLTLPYDRMVVDKSLNEGIIDAFTQKIGVPAASAQYVASALIKIEKAGRTISHMNALIYRIDESAKDGFIARNGVTVWGDPNTKHIMTGVAEFLEQLQSGKKLIETTWRY